MNAFAWSGLVTFILILLLAFFVILKDKKNRVYQLWFIFSLGAAIWEFGVYKIGITTTDIAMSIFWWRIAYIGVILIPFNFVIFIYYWLRIKKDLFYYFSFFFGLLYLILDLSDIIFHTAFFIPNQVRWVFNSFYYNIPQPVYSIFVIIWLFIIVCSLFVLIRVYKITTGVKHNQIMYFIVAFIVAYAGGSTCYFVVYHIDIYPYLNFSEPLYHIIMAYAIVRHKLMDLKMVLRKYSVYLASLTLILLAAIGIKYVFDRYFSDYTTWADFFILLFSISVFSSIKNYFFRIANKYFFSSLYDSREVIATLSDKLRSTLEIEVIYKFIAEILTNAFHAKAIGVLTYNESANKFLLDYNNGFNIGRQKEFPVDKELDQKFIKKNQIIVVEEIKSQFKDNQTMELLLKLGVEILAPLNVKDKTIGLIALSAKESGDMYNNEDLAVLQVVGAQTAIALENALLYQETKDFSVKLEKEVEKATHDLKRANAQLKKLDAAKSEFISIASHQLRTPLTVIKGYISMMLEGNFGQLTQPEAESLEKVFESNERLIQLVENLLNISRIESGRLQFDFQDTDLNKMVVSVLEELARNAKKKNLRLVYKQPAQAVPLIKIDDEKIRQVVMNLIDNAIKYTKQGSVTARLEQAENKIKFSVADSGMGIRPEDMTNLFKKFSRGNGTSLIHTEGTGLGLYVARMMIEAHHGKIWAESAGEGKGSKFCFELPLK